MGKLTSLVAFGFLSLLATSTSWSHSHGNSSREPRSCVACHTNGSAPKVSLTNEHGVEFGDRLIVRPGEQFTVLVHIETTPGLGVGLGARFPADLQVQSTHAQTVVERNTLFHRAVILEPNGRSVFPLRLRVYGGPCPRQIRVPIYAAAVNRNDSPSGDAGAETVLLLQVECAPAAAAAAVKPLDAKLPATTTQSALPGNAAATIQERAVQQRAPFVRQTTLTPRDKGSPGEAQLEMNSSGNLAEVSFGPASRHVVIDCVVRGVDKLRYSVSAGGREFVDVADAQDGHFYTVVPAAAAPRGATVKLQGEGRSGTFVSCTLSPTQ